MGRFGAEKREIWGILGQKKGKFGHSGTRPNLHKRDFGDAEKSGVKLRDLGHFGAIGVVVGIGAEMGGGLGAGGEVWGMLRGAEKGAGISMGSLWGEGIL